MLNSLGADWIFQSTLSLRRATGGDCYTQSERRDFNPRSPCGERRRLFPKGSAELAISIHALLAESDRGPVTMQPLPSYFNPRSPCGERRALHHPRAHHSGHFNPRSPCGERLNSPDLTNVNADFNPRSPCGERPSMPPQTKEHYEFQSTLSLRRATRCIPKGIFHHCISIHALLAESDAQTP